ncbi:cell envelope biogenesis protein TolA [Bartonella sp. CB169]|uniref:cell envelope biogenesis protein TolA n=1 Tax=Bartonella sp. CB169 TaxID=3112257 RepID=UPI00300E22DC
MNRDSYHSMKRGLALSFVAHVILFCWGSFHFVSSVRLQQPLEIVPITLAPLTQELSVQQGALNAPVREIPAVKSITKLQEKQEAHHVGEGQIDILAPFKPKEKPRLVETTPPPSGEENTPEKTSSKLTEQELSEANTEEIAEVYQEDAAKVMPKVPSEMHKDEEVMPSQELVSTLQKFSVKQTTIHPQDSKIILPEKSFLPQFKPKPTIQNAQESKKKNQKMKNQTIEDILAMEENNLLNRVRTQGGGAKRSSTPEALGGRKNMNDITKMAQTLVSIVGGCIQQKLKLVALGGDFKNRPIVRLRFYLNRERMVVGDPVIEPLSGTESQQAIMIRQVYAAVFSCQPYADLPHDQYDLWKQGFDFNVDPLREIIR